MKYVDYRLVRSKKLVLFFLLTLTFMGCIGNAKTSIDDIQVLPVREYYYDALAIAHDWQSDAYLQSANAITRQSDDSLMPLQVSYTFLSNNKRSEALLVWIREDLTIKSEVGNMGGSVIDRRAIRSEQWVIDVMEAIQIAQETKGNEFISKHQSVEITAYLEYHQREPDNTVVWRISYLKPFGEGSMYVEVNAVNGDVLEIRE